MNQNKMEYFPLSNFNESNWLNLKQLLTESKLTCLNDFKILITQIGNISSEIKAFDYIIQTYDEQKIIDILNKIIEFSLQLPRLIPNGKINRLSKSSQIIELTREEILCLLCHMFICSMKKTKKNKYWVNFENWLTDDRTCANVYFLTLFEYFNQAFNSKVDDNFFKEKVIFESRSAETEKVLEILEDSNLSLSSVNLKLYGSIGDESNIEVDFANMDIGYGISGTQEEILFGASPELCVAMLFCDTIESNECIIIKGARKVSCFSGYGLNLKFKSFIPLNEKNWSDRIIIAIDAIDYSTYENPFESQMTKSNLERELCKAYVGFSCVKMKTIDTGHWGCGCFSGNRCIKSLIQLVASSASSNSLNYICFGDKVFYENFTRFLEKATQFKKLTPKVLWNQLNELNFNQNSNIFETILENIERIEKL